MNIKFKMFVNRIRNAFKCYNINSLSEDGYYKTHIHPDYRQQCYIEDRNNYSRHLLECIDSVNSEDRNKIQWLTEYQIEDYFKFEDKNKEYNDDVVIRYRNGIGWNYAYIVWKKNVRPCVGEFKTYNEARDFIKSTYGLTMEDFKAGKRQNWRGGTFEVVWYVNG